MIGRIRRFLKRKAARETRTGTTGMVAIPVGYRPGWTLEYWRNRPDLVKYANELLKTPEFRELLSVLHHELPLDSTIEAVVAHKRVLRLIEVMAESQPVNSAEPEATFGAEAE